MTTAYYTNANQWNALHLLIFIWNQSCDGEAQWILSRSKQSQTPLQDQRFYSKFFYGTSYTKLKVRKLKAILSSTHTRTYPHKHKKHILLKISALTSVLWCSLVAKWQSDACYQNLQHTNNLSPLWSLNEPLHSAKRFFSCVYTRMFLSSCNRLCTFLCIHLQEMKQLVVSWTHNAYVVSGLWQTLCLSVQLNKYWTFISCCRLKTECWQDRPPVTDGFEL